MFLQVPVKPPLFAKLDDVSNGAEPTVAGCNLKFRKKHYRSNSGSPRNLSSKSSRSSTVVDAETQTDSMDLSETELSPIYDLPSKRIPQKVILREIRNESDDEGCNGNLVQLRFADSGILK